jgi:hypothetical protein
LHCVSANRHTYVPLSVKRVTASDPNIPMASLPCSAAIDLADGAKPKVTSGRVNPSEKLSLLQELDGLGTGPELGDGDGVGLELIERRLGLRRRDP